MQIVIDTREKPNFRWDFTKYGCDQIIKKLPAGDYSIIGFETEVAIERKRSAGELYSNLIKKYNTFSKELKILSTYRIKYILCEFPLEFICQFPKNSQIHPKFWSSLKGNNKFFLSRLELLSEFNIPILFHNSAKEAEYHAMEIFNVFTQGNA